MSLTKEEAKTAIVVLQAIQVKELKESTAKYLRPIEHKVWHDALQEQMIESIIELDKFLKNQANILYNLLKNKEQIFLPKKEDQQVIVSKALKTVELIIKADSSRKYKVWEYLDHLYNRVVVKDIKDTIVEYGRSFNKELEKIYSKVIENTYQKVSQAISTEETPFEFNKTNRWVQKYIKDKAIKWSKEITDTTEGMVKRQLLRGYESGTSTYDIAKNMKNNIGFSFSRAEKIARTEVFSSGNYIDYLAFNQNKNVIGYKWCSMGDKRVRSTHARANGQFRKKGEPFNIGGSKLLYPGDNSLGASAKEVVCCRCYLNPVFVGEDVPPKTPYDDDDVDSIEWLIRQSRDVKLEYLGSKKKLLLLEADLLEEDELLVPWAELKEKKKDIIWINNEAMMHSTIGSFTRLVNPKQPFKGGLQLEGGGHSQENIDALDRYYKEYYDLYKDELNDVNVSNSKKKKINDFLNNFEYTYKTYSNGVRVGNSFGNKKAFKRNENGQSWFPENWDREKMEIVALNIANKKDNFKILNETEQMYYKSTIFNDIEVVICYDKIKQKIDSIFPNNIQNHLEKKGEKLYAD